MANRSGKSGVGDEEPSKYDEIGGARRQRRVARLAVESPTRQERPLEVRTKQLEDVRQRRRPQDVQIREPNRRNRLHERRIRLRRVVVLDVVERHRGADLDADARRRSGGLGHRLQRFDHKAEAVLQTAAVRIRAVIRSGREELHRQVAGRRVQLHAVEARRDRVARGLRILGDHAGDFARLERPRHVVVLQPERVGPHLARGPDGRRRHQRLLRHPVRGVPDASHVHELQEHAAALRVDRVGDLAPRRDLLGRMNRRQSERIPVRPADGAVPS